MPPFEPWRISEHLHGHVGWLAAAALLHPAIALRRRRRAHLAVGMGVGVVSVAAALGFALYVPYRDTVRRSIFLASPAMGYLFERKEHLAFGALALAWAGAFAYAASLRASDDLRPSLLRAAHASFVVSAAFAVATALLGTWVAAFRSF